MASPLASPNVHEEIDRRLAKVGQRWTRGRRAVVDVMAKISAPVSVPELHSLVGPSIPLSTLYRIISDLLSAKVLIKLEFAEGFARFELDDALSKHHHHLVCTECGAVIDLELAELETVLDGTNSAIRKRTGFKVTSHRLDFFGLCAACAKAAN
jgi:Fur family transcriptional regulator, ferric uptake regulator